MNERILIVDDDEDTLDMIEMILERRGYRSIQTKSGLEALAFLARDVPDLIILDVMMPDMDGNKVCQRIRADSRTANVPVVMLTARSGKANQVEGLMAGADDYLVKPIQPEELFASIENALARAARAPVQETAQVVSVLGARSEVGATTLAVHLALALASRARTILIDLEPGGTAARHLGLSPAHGLNDLLAHAVDALDASEIEAAVTAHPSGLSVLASAIARVGAARAGAILNYFRTTHDVCVLDLGTELSDTALALAPRCHVLLLVLDLDRATLAQAKHIASSLGEIGAPWPELKLVCNNRAGVLDEAAQAAVRAALGKEATIIRLGLPEMTDTIRALVTTLLSVA